MDGLSTSADRVDAGSGLLRDLSADFAAELAQQYGTPFYLYDIDVLRHRIARVQHAFGDRCKILFAVKANPNLELLRAIRTSADGLDISSGGELKQAILAGYEPEDISFAGPAKSTEELRSAIQAGIGAISVECWDELNQIADLARSAEARARIALRLNPKQVVSAYGIKMGGRPVQFGFDEDELADVLNFVRSLSDVLDLAGLHVYAGSQGFDADGVAGGMAASIQLFRRAEVLWGAGLRLLNLGGGFGVSHQEVAKELDVEALADLLAEDIRHLTASGTRRVAIELGRYLAADAGVYVTRVMNTKTSRGRAFCTVDGGLNHHLTASGTFGSGLRGNFVQRNLSRPDGAKIVCNVAGASCNPTDLLGVNVEIAAPEAGDLIGIGKSGSYGLTASPLLFLGHRTPCELIRESGTVRLARRSYEITDFN